MKVLIYENSAGFSSYSYKLCNALANTPGMEISYMTTEGNSELLELSSDIDLLAKLKVYGKRKKNSFLWLFDRMYISLLNIIIRNKHIKKNRYDVISVQATIPIIDQFFLKRIKNKSKIIYTAHDVIPPIKSFYWSKKSLKKCYDAADRIIVHTEGNKNQLMELFGVSEEKISVIFHGTDINFKKFDSEKCKEKFGIDEKKVVFLFYGLIREQKGLDDIIKAMGNIPDVQLVIAGAMPFGESFEKYQKLLDEVRIDCVKFIKYIPNEWTDELYQACDVVCLPYKYFYSQSGVFMQSIKYRKPVVVSDVSSFREYIEKYNMGVLCNSADVMDLHEKLIKVKDILLNDKNYFNQQLEIAAKENSWAESAKKHIEIFCS